MLPLLQKDSAINQHAPDIAHFTSTGAVASWENEGGQLRRHKGAFQMPQKPTKTHAELEILLMAELRKYPECSNVDAVAITRPVGRLWGVAVMPDGPLVRPECRKKIWEVTERLCNKYDLAQEPLAGTESTIG
jgi:hypothetical protein